MQVIPFVNHEKMWEVGSVYCLGKNYRAHAIEMGQIDPKPPVVFIKPAAALTPLERPIVLDGDGGEVHHEVELVVGVTLPPHLDGTGQSLSVDEADEAIVAYTVGLDLTRRTLQSAAKKAGEPWAASKGFPGSAPIGELLHRSGDTRFEDMAVRLVVNGETRQAAPVSTMVLSPAQAVHLVSGQFPIASGDLVFTGTPAGVGPLRRGDKLAVHLEPEIEVRTEVGG